MLPHTNLQWNHLYVLYVNLTLYALDILVQMAYHVHIPFPHARIIHDIGSLAQALEMNTRCHFVLKRKHTNPINVRSFSSSKERVC